MFCGGRRCSIIIVIIIIIIIFIIFIIFIIIIIIIHRCKYESGTAWKKEDMALRGIYSHWITDDILAMARPNTPQIQVRR